ncbi:MAG: hypothetical protein WC641_03330 [Patescibacteria group bacterium]
MTIQGKLKQIKERAAAGQILEMDLDQFIANPLLWRKAALSACAIAPEDAQAFWRGVYDELGMNVAVSTMSALTDKQIKSLDKFNFLPVYIPSISEDRYPEGFIKPAWGKYLDISEIKRKPLGGFWVAIETIAKPDWNDPAGYAEDRLMAAVKRSSRFDTSHDDLEQGLLKAIAKATGFPKKGTRLPTAEEWNFIANLFNWLRKHRGMRLPDLGAKDSWEWCENACGSGNFIIVGDREIGGLAGVRKYGRGDRSGDVGFRVLAVL